MSLSAELSELLSVWKGGIALESKGFFVVTGQSDANRSNVGQSGAKPDLLYTRDGHFRLVPLDAKVNDAVLGRRSRLETQDGFTVIGNEGNPILLDPRRPVEFGRDGTVRQDGLVVNRLLVADPGAPQQLQKRSGNYFALDSPTAVPRSTTAQVQQGKLETANVTPAESAVRLINVMRQFESLQKALQIGGEMNRRSVEEVAKFT